MSTGEFPESLTQATLVGTMLVGRLGALQGMAALPPGWALRRPHASDAGRPRQISISTTTIIRITTNN